MNVQTRINTIRLLQQIENNRSYCEVLGIRDASQVNRENRFNEKEKKENETVNRKGYQQHKYQN